MSIESLCMMRHPAAISWNVSFWELSKASDILNVPIPIEVLSQVGSCFLLTNISFKELHDACDILSASMATETPS